MAVSVEASAAEARVSSGNINVSPEVDDLQRDELLSVASDF